MSDHTIAAIVVSLPERLDLLREALASVKAQHRPPDHCLVGVDYAGEPGRMGEAANMNTLIRGITTHHLRNGGRLDDLWFAFLHDDDLWRPDHLATAEAYMNTGEADVIVARCTTTGGRPPLVRRFGPTQMVDDFADIHRDNWFAPSMVVARASTFGLWTPAEPPPPTAEPGAGAWIDWTNWRRLQTAGARFVDTGLDTVVYRFGPWNHGRSWTPPTG